MLANRQDAQPALANVDHGLLGGPVPSLLPQVSRSEGRDLVKPPAWNIARLSTASAFYFLNLSALKRWRDVISGSFYP